MTNEPPGFSEVAQLLTSGLQEHMKEQRYALTAAREVKEDLIPVIEKHHEAISKLYVASQSTHQEIKRLDGSGRSLARQTSASLTKFERWAEVIKNDIQTLYGHGPNILALEKKMQSVDDRLKTIEDKLDALQRVLSLAGREHVDRAGQAVKLY